MYETNREQEQSFYQTGFTRPKKTRRGPVAILLVLFIFFSGMNTAFRLLDIRLFREVTQDSAIASASVQFAKKSRSAAAPGLPSLGLTGKDVSGFEQKCFCLPAGFYITQVASGSGAEAAGIVPGDILVQFNGQRTAGVEALKKALHPHAPQDRVALHLYRNGVYFTVELSLDEAQ